VDRPESFRNHYSPAMRVAGIGALELLLPSATGDGREPVADANARRAIHADSVLRHPTYDGLAEEPWKGRQSQTSSALVASTGIGSDLPEAAVERAGCAAQDLPLSAAWSRDRSSQPSLEHGHHICAIARRLCVLGGDHGLVQPVRPLVGSVRHHGVGVLHFGFGPSLAKWTSGDLQQRSRLAIHERRFYTSAQSSWHSDQHGWQRSGSGQCVRRETVALGQIRGGLSQGLLERLDRDRQPGRVFPVLQWPTLPPIAWLQDAGKRSLRTWREEIMNEHILTPNPERSIRIKEPAGWFVAGEGFRRALVVLSDGAFKLFAYLSLHSDRRTGRFAGTHKELAAALSKSKRIIGTYVAELDKKEICRVYPGKNQFAATVFEISDFYWPYHRFSARPASSEAYVEKVRECFEGLGCTAGKLGAAGIETARRLQRREIPLKLVIDAMFLGACRKVDSWLNGGPSDSIHSMSYFEPLIAEIQATPLPAGYSEHLRNQLPRLLKRWRSGNN
jgi:hypothetical protein